MTGSAVNRQVLLEEHGSPSKVLRVVEAPRPIPGQVRSRAVVAAAAAAASAAAAAACSSRSPCSPRGAGPRC